jgi:hypothetical protein
MHQALYQHAKSWRNPLLSIWMHVVAWLMCFRSTVFVLLCVGGALYHAAHRAEPQKGELQCSLQRPAILPAPALCISLPAMAQQHTV